MHQLFNFSLL